MSAPSGRDARSVIDRSTELAEEHRVAESVALVEDGMIRFPDDARLRLHAATLALVARESDAAKEYLRQAVQLAPDDPGLLTRAASQMDSLHEPEEVEQWVRRAAGLAPDEFALAGHLSYLMSKVLLRRGYTDRAEPLVRAAFEDDPVMPNHGTLLAALLERRDERKEALAVIEETLEHSPGDAQLEEIRERLRHHRSQMRQEVRYAWARDLEATHPAPGPDQRAAVDGVRWAIEVLEQTGA